MSHLKECFVVVVLSRVSSCFHHRLPCFHLSTPFSFTAIVSFLLSFIIISPPPPPHTHTHRTRLPIPVPSVYFLHPSLSFGHHAHSHLPYSSTPPPPPFPTHIHTYPVPPSVSLSKVTLYTKEFAVTEELSD